MAETASPRAIGTEGTSMLPSGVVSDHQRIDVAARGLCQPQYVACDLCGSEAYTVLYPNTIQRPLAESDFTVFGELAEHARVVRCSRCRLIYANPRDDMQALGAMYAAMPPEPYLQERGCREATFAALARRLRRVVASGRVLDVGCASGLFLNVLPPAYEAYGLEPSAESAAVARQRFGERIRCGGLGDVDFPDGFFDLVTLWDVIEHLPSPRQAMARVARWTRPGGYVALITPDIGSLTARVLGGRWPQLIRQHIYYFTTATLSQLLRSAGYRVVSRPRLVRQFTLGYLLKRARSGGQGGATAPAGGWRSWRVPVTLFDDHCVIARKETEVAMTTRSSGGRA